MALKGIFWGKFWRDVGLPVAFVLIIGFAGGVIALNESLPVGPFAAVAGLIAIAVGVALGLRAWSRQRPLGQ